MRGARTTVREAFIAEAINDPVVRVVHNDGPGVRDERSAFLGDKVEDACVKVSRREGTTLQLAEAGQQDRADDVHGDLVEQKGDAIRARGRVARGHDGRLHLR
jgi:hypothetical protein